jgi:hypothetical protein
MIGSMKTACICTPQTLIVWGVLFFMVSGCSPTPKAGYRPWTDYASPTFEFYPIRIANQLIIPSYCVDKACIKSVDLFTGKENWAVSNPVFEKIFYNFQPYSDSSVLVLPIGNTTICIDVKNGEVLWVDEHPTSGDSNMFGDGTYAYRTFPSLSDTSFHVLQFDLYSGRKEKIMTYKVNNASSSMMRSPQPIVISGDTTLITSVIDHVPLKNTESYILKWRKKDEKKIVKHEVYPRNKKGVGASLPPLVINNKSYWVSHTDIVKYNNITEQEVWRIKLPRGLLTSRLAVHEGTLYAACENEKLYAISIDEGSIKWELGIAGTPSRLFCVEDNLYLIGGSDRLLYNIDINSESLKGKYRFKDQQITLHRASFFTEQLAVLTDGKFWYSKSNKNLYEELIDIMANR